jgi:hypothetical protein
VLPLLIGPVINHQSNHSDATNSIVAKPVVLRYVRTFMRKVRWVFAWAAFAAVAAAGLQVTMAVKADKKYEIGSSKVELIGVCKANETEVACWGPEGEPAPQIESELKAAFASGDYRTVPIKYGRKTRIAVFKTTNPPYGDPASTRIDPYFQSQNGNFDWPSRSTGAIAGALQEETRAVIITAGPTETTGQVSTSLTRNEAPSARIPLREGARLDYMGCSFTIRKITKTSLDLTAYDPAGSSRWAIAMTAKMPEGLRPNLSWAAIDESSLVIRTLDKDGNPVIADPNAVMNIRNNPDPNRAKTPNLFQAALTPAAGYQPQPSDDYTIFTNINPAKVKEIYAFGSLSTPVTITGIPLEPKR